MRKVIAILILSCLFCAWSVVPALAVSVGNQENQGYLYAGCLNAVDGAEFWRIGEDSIRTSLRLISQPQIPYTGEVEEGAGNEMDTKAEDAGEKAIGLLAAAENFAIVFGIALAAGVIGFIAFKSARKRGEE